MSSQVFEQLSTNMSLAQNKNLLQSCHGCFLSLSNFQKQFFKLLYPPHHRPPTLTQTQKRCEIWDANLFQFRKDDNNCTIFCAVSFSMPCSLVLKPVANRSCSLWNQNEEEVIKLSVFKEKDFFPKDFHLLVHLDMDTQIVVVQPGASNLILE